MAILGDGTKQTLNTGKTYMRTFLNTELRGYNQDYYPRLAVSKNPETGGQGGQVQEVRLRLGRLGPPQPG